MFSSRDGSTNRAVLGRLLALGLHYRWGCARLVMLQFLLLALGVAGLALTGMAIDLLQCQVQGEPVPQWPLGLAPPAGWTPLECATLAAAALVMVGVVKMAASFWCNVATARLLQQQIVVQLRGDVFERLGRLSFRFHRTNASGSLINRVTSDIQNVRLFIDGVVLQVVVLAISLACYLTYMLRIHVGLTLACLATTPLLWILAIRFSRQVRPAYRTSRELSDRMLMVLSENVRGAQVVQGFGRQEAEVEKFRAANRAVKDQQQWIFWRVSLFTPTMEMLMSLNLFVLLAYGGYLAIEGRLALGSGLIVFCALLQQFSAQVSKVTNIINATQQSLAAAQRVFEVLDSPLEIQSPARAHRLSVARGAIEFRDVSFAHDPDQPVLEAINLRIEPGQSVALLGATGSGKSTLLGLIPRFLDATRGNVFVDGVDVRQYDLDDLRRAVGFVFQENFLFSDTVAANIALGCPQASPAEIRRAATIACADRFITELPQGYDTVLAEGGRDLSGGQRQRLAIARAILRQPPILLLDDPTAAIDAGTEEEIWQAMEQAMTGRTTFIVAHRASTLRRADLVVVLKAGRIVEMGSHAALMAQRKLYWQTTRSPGPLVVETPREASPRRQLLRIARHGP